MVVALVLGCVANLLETQQDQPSVAQAESWDQHIAFPEPVAAETHSEPRQQVAYLWLNHHSLLVRNSEARPLAAFLDKEVVLAKVAVEYLEQCYSQYLGPEVGAMYFVEAQMDVL